jgi:hypothetical protein
MVKMMFTKSAVDTKESKSRGQLKVHEVEMECRWGREGI